MVRNLSPAVLFGAVVGFTPTLWLLGSRYRGRSESFLAVIVILISMPAVGIYCVHYLIPVVTQEIGQVGLPLSK